jgi:hypothetical protein
VESEDEQTRTRFLSDAERISAMADEAGQSALMSVTMQRDILEGLESGHARAFWMFMYEPASFRHAEDARLTDERRRGRMWDGFVGRPALRVPTTPSVVERFKQAVRQRFACRNVHIDIFDRQRTSFDGQSFELVQATIYREGQSDNFLEFVDGRLDRTTRRPVYEAAVTYEPGTGVIEVVASDRESREDLARIFATELLGIECDGERLPFREFDLDILLRPYDFPTDAVDGIESVKVIQLRLMPLDTAGERVTLECSRQAPHTIWDMAEDRFGSEDPLVSGEWLATQAKLIIRFHPEPGSRRHKTLPLTVTMPHGCDLKDRTDRERIIGDKYLANWQLVKRV